MKFNRVSFVLPFEDQVAGSTGHLVERLPADWTRGIDAEIRRDASLVMRTS